MGLDSIQLKLLKSWLVSMINFGKWRCRISKKWLLDLRLNGLNFGGVMLINCARELWDQWRIRITFASRNFVIFNIGNGHKMSGRYGWRIGLVKLSKDSIEFMSRAHIFLIGSEVPHSVDIQLEQHWEILSGACAMPITIYNLSAFEILGGDNGKILVKWWLQEMTLSYLLKIKI